MEKGAPEPHVASRKGRGRSPPFNTLLFYRCIPYFNSSPTSARASYPIVCSMLELKPNCRFVSYSPTVMSWRNQAHVAGVKFDFFPVIHPYTKFT